MHVLMLILTTLLGFGVATPAVSASPAAQSQTALPLEIDGTAVSALGIDPMTGEAVYAVAGTAIYKGDGGGGWTASGVTPEREAVVVDSRNPDRLWAGSGLECYRGGGASQPMLRSDDAGATWTEAGPAGYVPLASWDPGSIVIARDCGGLQISPDGGASWSMPEGLSLGSEVTAFAVLSSPESAAGLTVMVGVTGEGGTSQLYRVHISDPAAPEVSEPLQTYFGNGSLAVADQGAVLLGAPQGVLRSEDRGETWTTIRLGLESTTLEQDPIEYFPPNVEPNSFGLPAMVARGDEVYVAGVDGIYQLAADGQSWQKIIELNATVARLAVEPGTGALLIQTDDGQVLRSAVH